MTTRLRRLAMLALTAFSLLLLAPSAMAEATWNFGDPTTCVQNGTGNGNSYQDCSALAPNTRHSGQIDATAFSTTKDAATATPKFDTATINRDSVDGFGVKSRLNDSSTLPIDNTDSTDAILLTFTSSVVLRQLVLGSTSVDSDFTVLRYTGASAPNVKDKTLGTGGGTLISSGWESVGNYFDRGADTPISINSGGLSSSWWLISAYNSNYGGPNFGTAEIPGVADAIRLFSVTGKVPEPASLALVGVALAALLAVRRRRGQGT